jgi:16S rRNA (cytosine967-C5)-methyltransferase
MRIPDHAAVSATVEVARKRLGESKASFVNALLRSVTRKSIADWFAPLDDIKDPISRFSIQYSHPDWIISAYYDLLKNWAHVEEELRSNNVPAIPTLVSWPGFSTREELVALGAEPTAYSELGARFRGNPGTLDLIKHRLAGVQDEGSQLVASVFAAAAAGKSWLDLCAGPGGKAALLASIAKGREINFTANEFSDRRADLVRKVVHGARVWSSDGRLIADHKESFDAILVDAPCTGLGALRRRPEVRWRRNISNLRELTQLQRELLEGALSVLNVNGVLGYATCSPHLAETSVQIMDVLARHKDLEQIDVKEFLPSNLQDAQRGDSMSLWTHKHGTDAMFLALLRKKPPVEDGAAQ